MQGCAAFQRLSKQFSGGFHWTIDKSYITIFFMRPAKLRRAARWCALSLLLLGHALGLSISLADSYVVLDGPRCGVNCSPRRFIVNLRWSATPEEYKWLFCERTTLKWGTRGELERLHHLAPMIDIDPILSIIPRLDERERAFGTVDTRALFLDLARLPPDSPAVKRLPPDRYFRARCPHWFVVVITGTMLWPWVAMLVMHRLRARRRLKRGMCPNCGYDMRANPQLCSECGQTTPP